MIPYIISMQTRSPNRPAASGLFREIERLHGDLPWGAFLDAGTGRHSIGWAASLATERWTAVSGAEAHAPHAAGALAAKRRATDPVVAGNWADPALVAGAPLDQVVADH